jgi:putative spermidine/putrescine transport system permease protein
MILIALIFIVILPFFPLVISSVSMEWRWPQIVPENFSLRAWRYIFLEDKRTVEAVWNSILISFTLLVLNTIIALPAANAIGRREFRGKTVIEGLLFAPIIIPPFISVMGIHFNFIKFGLTESLLGVILAHMIPTLPYMIRALIISFKTLNCDLENVAETLGANSFEKYYYVIFPHIFPALIAGGSLTILISFSQYVSTLIIGGGEVLTLTMLIFPFISGGDMVIGSAYVVLFVLLNIAALLFMEFMLKKFYSSTIKINM